MDINTIRQASYLLPPPGGGVVRGLLNEIARLCVEIHRLYRENALRAKCNATQLLLEPPAHSDRFIRDHRWEIDKTFEREAIKITGEIPALKWPIDHMFDAQELESK